MEREKNTEISGYNKRVSQSGGYGIVYREIMRNKNLTAEAKAIYAYLCSFAGNSSECYPGVDLMATELCMSKDRLYKHLNILVDAGVIKKSQSRAGNRWGKTVYKIHHDFKTANTCFAYTENTNTEKAVSINSVDEKQDTNNNSFKSNSLENIKHYYDLIWSAYPRKGTAKEKESSFYWFEKELNNSGYCLEQFYEAVKAFGQDSKKIYEDKRKIPGFSYFFIRQMYKKYL